MVLPERTSVKTDLNSPDLGQPHGLAGDILIAVRHPCVTENGAHTVSQTTVLWTSRGQSSDPGISIHKIRPLNQRRPQF
jgi:hypothetical protein